MPRIPRDQPWPPLLLVSIGAVIGFVSGVVTTAIGEWIVDLVRWLQ